VGSDWDALAIVATLLDQQVLNHEMILLGLVIGSLVERSQQRVQMTEMPQMVGLLNGLGGAAALVAVAEFWRLLGTAQPIPSMPISRYC
jgi:NAD(P) transhydrogenase subunit beta